MLGGSLLDNWLRKINIVVLILMFLCSVWILEACVHRQLGLKVAVSLLTKPHFYSHASFQARHYSLVANILLSRLSRQNHFLAPSPIFWMKNALDFYNLTLCVEGIGLLVWLTVVRLTVLLT